VTKLVKHMDIYEGEKKLESKMNNSADDVIKYALLETLVPTRA